MVAGPRRSAYAAVDGLLYGAERAEAASRRWKRPFLVRIAGYMRVVLVSSVRCLDWRAIRGGVQPLVRGRIPSVARWSVSPSAAPAPNNAMQRTREQAGRFWKAVSASR
jgi:hypothetical protein